MIQRYITIDTKSGCWRNSNLKRTWISCMLDSSLKDAWQLHHVPSRKRIQLSFAWKQHPVSTDTFWWWLPTGWRCRKNNSMLLLLWWKLLTAALVVDRPLANLLMLTADDKCPLVDEEVHWVLRWCCRDFQSDNHLSISLTVSPLSAERRDNLLQNIFELPPSGVGEFHCRTPSFNYMRVPSSIHCWLHYVWM